MKAKIFDTSAAAETSISEVEAALSIPQSGTEKYGDVLAINNPESEYVGKFTFPVLTRGTWKCDQLFSASELVEWDDSWFEEPE